MFLSRFLRLSAHIQMLPVLESGEETLVGGQAVMEGVMMRAPHSYCVAVRKPNGEIVTEETAAPPHVGKVPDLQVPDLARPGNAGPGHVAGRQGAASFRPTRRSTTGTASGTEQDGKKPAEICSWMMAANLIVILAFFIFAVQVRAAVAGHAAWAMRFRRSPDASPST